MSTGQLLLVFDTSTDTAPLAAEQWANHFASFGVSTGTYRFGSTAVIVADEGDGLPPSDPTLPEPVRTVRTTGTTRLARREVFPDGTVVTIGQAQIGNGSVAVFAGPCAVENRELLLSTASAAAEHGAVGLRGGAFKPRTSPYSFQGLHWEGLDMLAEARERIGLPVVTEVVDPSHVQRVAEVADALQIGARNMQNFALLTEAGRSGKPVVLKRGFGVTIDEFIQASEYLMVEGNNQVVLCERGIRTFEPATRFTLDLSAVAVLKRRTHLPVMVDPSHSAGVPELVEPLTLAAVAAGADALLIDVHVQPAHARCDGPQALLPTEFGQLMDRLDTLALGLGRKLAGGQRLAEPAVV